ncbi:hypothetical protein HZA99_01475 [Candidatus Woesearchaeota archaeon]|nr:hypothetical protein [Candidatus Woesearchaeota archaeon]
MVDGKLTNYIQQQLHAGFSLEVIRTALLQGGYSSQEVDGAIAYVKEATKNAPLQQQTQFQQQEEMLVNYVRQYLKQGYTLQQIETFLLQNRYPPFIVQKAIADAQSQQRKGFSLPHISLPSPKFLLIVFLIFLIIAALAGTAWFFLNTTTSQEQPVDFSVTLDTDTLAPGETLYINNDFINFPSPRQYPITLYYTINDKETLTRVDSWQLSFDISDRLKNEKHIILRTIAPAEYELDTKMSYGPTSKQTQAYFTVSTNEKEIAAAEQHAETQQAVSEQAAATTGTEEAQVPTETTQPTETVVAATEKLATGEDDYVNYNTAKELAVTDGAGATQYCDLIVSATKKDECYWAVAKSSGDKSYCTTIVADNTRDACWIGFAFDKNDYTVCDEIANPFIKQSCQQLEKVNELKQQTSS